MSKAFVKEEAEDQIANRLPDREVPAGPNLVTAEGLAQIDATFARLQTERQRALDANDPDEIARKARDLRYWAARLATAQLVESPRSSDVVAFGSIVTISRDDGREQTFRIVGTDEGEPAEGTLSHLSPLAKAMLGNSVGDAVNVGGSEAEIIAIG